MKVGEDVGKGCGMVGECGYSVVGTWYEFRMEVRREQSERWSTVRGKLFSQWGHESGKR